MPVNTVLLANSCGRNIWGARIAGIEILWQQLQDNPDERTQRMIMILFVEFVKNPPDYDPILGGRDDVSLILKLTREG